MQLCTTFDLASVKFSGTRVIRVRTIPVLGYRVLGDICMYWVVSVSGDVFFGRDTGCDIVVH